MFIKQRNNPEPFNIVPSSLQAIPEEIEALREIWKNEIVNFLEALSEVRHLLEPHISLVLEKLESIVDPDELSEYCFPTLEGARATPIATDIDIAIHAANLEVLDEYPNGKSQVQAFKFMRKLYEPYRNHEFENWRNRYFKS